MINAFILKDHHEFIDPNIWYGWHRTAGEPGLLVVHNERGVFMWIRYSVFFNSRWPEYSRDDWMGICRTCGHLVEVGRFECNDHFGEKLKALMNSPEFMAALEKAKNNEMAQSTSE